MTEYAADTDGDDRPVDKLAVIAAELATENRPTVEELMAERYGGGARQVAPGATRRIGGNARRGRVTLDRAAHLLAAANAGIDDSWREDP